MVEAGNSVKVVVSIAIRTNTGVLITYYAFVGVLTIVVNLRIKKNRVFGSG